MASKTSSNRATNGSAKRSNKSNSNSESKASFGSNPSRAYERKDGQEISNTRMIDEDDIILKPNDYSIDRFLSDSTVSNPQFTYSIIEESLQAHTGWMKMKLGDFDRVYCQWQRNTT